MQRQPQLNAEKYMSSSSILSNPAVFLHTQIVFIAPVSAR
jgi:hypothetical protein